MLSLRFRVRLSRALRLPILHRYLLGEFFSVLGLCLFASLTVFLLFDFLERIGPFMKENASIGIILQYFFFKIPSVIHLTIPIAVLIATLLTVGRLSQNSEITAMRACGMSVFWIIRPLLGAGLLISLAMFFLGETVVPWATQRVEDVYHLDIKKKAEKGALSRDNIWYRSDENFYNIGAYDSRTATLRDITVLEMDDNFHLRRQTEANIANWQGGHLGWLMKGVTEVGLGEGGKVSTTAFSALPLVIKEKPADFFSMRRSAESLSYGELTRYIAKLQSEGVSVTQYLVERSAKTAFPLVNVILILVAFPFALGNARSGTFTRSFVAGISIGFGYYLVHALSLSLGSAELLPPTLAAWTANIFCCCVGSYLLLGAETS